MRTVANSSVLGPPTGPESHWDSAGGGWAQPFQRGWALVADDGRGGLVAGPLLPYFTSHGYVSATGWPTTNAVTDSQGTYQRFGSKDGSIKGTLMSSSSGTFRLKGGMEQAYFDQGLRSALGSITGDEARWSAGGGGWAQHFAGGWLLYKSSAVKGYVPASFPWPDLGKIGWPKSGPQSACGGRKITFEKGYETEDSRWCPSGSWMAQPVAAIAAPSMPGVLYSHAFYAARGLTGQKDRVVGDGGLNVYFAQQALGVHNSFSHWSTIDGSTSAAIKRYQAGKAGLSATGNLDPKTFTMLTHRDWNAGTRTAQVQVSSGATAQQRVDGEIAFAQRMANLRRPYIYGAGSEQFGMDCSGLALASLHAAGVNLRNVDILKDIVYPEWMANAMWQGSGLPRVLDLRGVKRGDLVFFSVEGAHGRATHVAIAADDGAHQLYQSTDLPRVFGVEKVAMERVGAGSVLGYIRPIQ